MSAAVETRKTLPAGTWNLDPVHSQVGFAVEYAVGTFRGSFSPAAATLEVGEDGTATFVGRAPVAGLRVQEESLMAHLQTPDFFDAERAPEISFGSTRIRRSGDEIAIDGDLTIKGITQPVALKGTVTEPAEHFDGSVRFGLRLETTIDRTSFGVDWNTPLPNGEPALANEVTLTGELYLVKA
jgi:polyisoprenoid-binding protein YceI